MNRTKDLQAVQIGILARQFATDQRHLDRIPTVRAESMATHDKGTFQHLPRSATPGTAPSRRKIPDRTSRFPDDRVVRRAKPTGAQPQITHCLESEGGTSRPGRLVRGKIARPSGLSVPVAGHPRTFAAVPSASPEMDLDSSTHLQEEPARNLDDPSRRTADDRRQEKWGLRPGHRLTFRSIGRTVCRKAANALQ